MKFAQFLILMAVAGLISWLNVPRASRVPYYADPTFQPHWQPVAHRVGPFQLTDQYGRTVDERILEGKITAVHYFFASCGSVCPALMTRLKEMKARAPQVDAATGAPAAFTNRSFASAAKEDARSGASRPPVILRGRGSRT